jgi:hypothetical protein
MAAGQNNAAVVDFRLRAGGAIEGRHNLPLDQRSPAGGAPVGDSFSGKHGMAMAAKAFHE